ncbi:myotubularin-related protein DDB_G0290005-like [Saccostrea cucullata]|uniref:myotubularin-related protein DDB_G0290005-like n=1 Tax=Saccostrea cuccullata TaxID=36930 RepID=UPI002ED04C0C
MATADTQSAKPRSSRRRLHNPQVENDFAPGDGEPPARPPPLQRSQSQRERPTKQLDFYQAMLDFKAMFPTMDADVIEAVLRSNDGAVDDTIDQLLTMSIDGVDKDFVDIPPELLSPVEDGCPTYHEKRTEDSPPSYTEAVQSNNSIWTTPLTQATSKTSPTPPKRSPIRSNTTPTPKTHSHGHSKSSSHHHSRSSHHHHHHRRSHRSRQNDDMVDSLALSNTEPKRPLPTSSISHSTPVKSGFRNWNPPMLGTLPDDFLRLTVPKSPDPLSLEGFLPHNSERTHHNISRRNRHTERLSNSSSEHKKKISRSRSERAPERPKWSHGGEGLPVVHAGKSVDVSPGMSKSLIISSHEFSQDMLDEKLKENERRRRKAVKNVDLEMSQYLEDERLAIALQNSEFLQELRGNEDFMKTLEKDHRDMASFEPTMLPALQPRETTATNGYGDDRQTNLEAFPFTQNSPKQKDEDAELRRQLNNMGGASKKQFMALAKKFFSRRKKKMTLKQIQKEKLAPSMVNLLDSDEEDFVPDEDSNPYNQKAEIEPLPDSLLRIPNVRTPDHQRTSSMPVYHDNKATDFI